MSHTPGPWVRYDPITATYKTPDGTSIAEELADNIECVADVIRIAALRDQQRAAIARAEGEPK